MMQELKNNDANNNCWNHKYRNGNKRLEYKMWNNDDIVPLNRRYPIATGKEHQMGNLTYSLMAEEPDKAKKGGTCSVITIISLTNVNDKYAGTYVFPSSGCLLCT